MTDIERIEAEQEALLLSPHASFLVISEDRENELSEVNLALDGLAWILESHASHAALPSQIGQQALIEVPPECMAAMLRIFRDRIDAACHNPPLSKLRRLRPDLFFGG